MTLSWLRLAVFCRAHDGRAWKKWDAALIIDAILERRQTMKRVMVATTVLLFAMGTALAQEACEAKAMSKDGKTQKGAVKKRLEERREGKEWEPRGGGRGGPNH
jgi:hypothetical protein